MKNKKTKTFIYEDLGFPVKLIDCPMKKIFGVWVIDIDMNAFQRFVLQELIYQPYRLTGGQFRFMRKYMEISTTDFGEKLGVSHAAIVKWEKGQTHPSPAQEVYIRMFLLEFLQQEEVQKIYDEVKPAKLVENEREKPPVFSVHAKGFEHLLQTKPSSVRTRARA
jgi:DNA-binding transcriptional regulator YiaG